jgi:hypothetical protein
MLAAADILLEAHRLITGERQQTYGHPYEDYSRVKRIYYALTGVELTVESCILFMVAVKLARLRTNLEAGLVHHDTLVDTIGYLGCLNIAHKARP